jgi:homocysteine S-methyltransferase
MFQPIINIDNNPFNISKENFQPLILDGAMGSYLQEKGFKPNYVLWMTEINQTNPDMIVQIHKEYIEAGADIITSSTFRTNPFAFESTGKDWVKNVKQAVNLAQTAATDYDKKLYIAGSNAPAEDCYQKERTISNNKVAVNHKYHIDLLIDSGVHFILNETQSHFDEIKIICKHCCKNKIPYSVSLYVTDSLTILSEESLKYVLQFIQDYEPLAIGFNCIPPSVFKKIREQVELSFNWGYYLNCGSENPADKTITCGVNTIEYIEIVKESINFNPSFIGSCCGSNPNYIRKIKEFFDGRNKS